MKNLTKTLMMFVALAWGCTLCACSSDSNDNGSGGDVEFSVAQENITVAQVGGSTTFSVKSNVSPTISSDASWCKVALKSSSSTTFNYTVTIDEYAANSKADYNDRVASITIKCGNKTASINVTQTPKNGIIIDTATKEISVSKDGGTVSIPLRANGEYEMVADVEWISIVSTRATLERYSAQVKVDANIGSARNGMVSFTLGDAVESVTISQEAGLIESEITANAKEVAKAMYPGWNLGNTMEATGTGLGAETFWQSTKTTQEIIDYVKAQGFKSVRIPCSWSIHMNSSNDIDAAWMARVTEVVNYCINDGLYVLLNDHWDNNWLENSMSSYDATKASKLKRMWTQIANNFKDYDEHLLFAGLNEPAADNQTKTDNLVKYEKDFIDAVRATGGNNARRILVVQGPSTDIDNTNKFYNNLPKDNAEAAMMVEVHFYTPWNFCGMDKDQSWGKASWFWGVANHVSGSDRNSTWGEETELKSRFDKMKKQFVDKNIPVIIGEYGCQWRELSTNQDKHDASVLLFHKMVNQEAGNMGMVPMVWDINVTNRKGTEGVMSVINRNNLSIICKPAMDGIKEGVAAAKWPY